MLENNLQDRHEQTVNSDALFFSPTEETSPFFCAHISFGKSYSTATCCQGCQSIALTLLRSSHRYQHILEAKNTEGITGGIHHRSSVLSEQWVLTHCFYILSPAFCFLALWETVVSCLGIWPGHIYNWLQTTVLKPESSHLEKANPCLLSSGLREERNCRNNLITNIFP